MCDKTKLADLEIRQAIERLRQEELDLERAAVTNPFDSYESTRRRKEIILTIEELRSRLKNPSPVV